ncbi:MAG: hypothetical protein K8I60_16730 [Anaerolineae bacterium]|nr:hypothetical protein [Anaerolineae bacterium]
MHTSAQAVQLLQEALTKAQAANDVINDLIVEHEYQDVASLIAQAGAALLEAASRLMQSDEAAGLEALDAAEDLLDEVYVIIDGETDED